MTPGSYPRLAEWDQGRVRVRYHFVTGMAQYKGQKATGRSPQESFVVKEKTRLRPKRQTLRMGIYNVPVSEEGIRFEKTSRKKRLAERLRERRL